MFQNFLLKKMLRLQGVPPDQIDMFIKMMEKDPELFKKIGEEVETKIKNGMDKTKAGMEVMQKYQNELKKLVD